MMNRTRSTPARLQPYVSRAFHGDAAPRRPSLRGRIIRRTAGAIAAIATVALLIPAFAGISSPTLTVSCDPTRVGVATTCRTTITGTVALLDQQTTKSIARGIFTRGNMPSAGTPVRVATANVNWSALEPTQDNYTLAPIESLLDTAEARGLDGVRLRVMLGRFSPDWAKAIADGPVTYTHVQGTSMTTGTIPDLWDPTWQAEAAELFAAIAARYDTDPRLRLIFATGGMTWYGEPLLRSVSYEPNRTNLLAAGYTRAADEALQRAQLDWLKVFTLTPIGLAYNPYRFIRADGTVGSDLSFVASLMDYHLAAFGGRTVLQNNSIRSSYIGTVSPFYQLFLDRLSAPGTTSYQTAASMNIGDSDATMNWAIDYLKASGVELVDGYPDVYTDAELTGYDTALSANDPSGVATGSIDVTWATSADGTFGAGSCAADAASDTTCTVRYVPSLGSVGSHTITATYTDTATATSGSTQLRVSPRRSSTTLACATPVAAGTKSTCTVSVSDGSAGQVSAPTGTVRIAVDGAVSASCALGATSGSASGCAVDVAAVSGTHDVTAAYGGDADHEASASVAVPLTVEAPPADPPPTDPPPEEPPAPPADATAPTVKIVSPVDGAGLTKGKVTIAVEATDDVGVTKVEFLVDGAVKCVDTSSASWTCNWTLSNRPAERYTLTAIAYDGAGNRSEHSITVTPLR